MKQYLLLILTLIFTSNSFGSGPAGEIVSLNCSRAIASALKYIEEKHIKTNVSQKNGAFICVTPDDEEIYIRLQSPGLGVKDSKHMFFVNAHTYEVLRSSFGR